MMYCKYCDYFKPAAEEQKKTGDSFFCEMTGTLFEEDVENLNMDHPCHCLNNPIFGIPYRI